MEQTEWLRYTRLAARLSQWDFKLSALRRLRTEASVEQALSGALIRAYYEKSMTILEVWKCWHRLLRVSRNPAMDVRDLLVAQLGQCGNRNCENPVDPESNIQADRVFLSPAATSHRFCSGACGWDEAEGEVRNRIGALEGYFMRGTPSESRPHAIDKIMTHLKRYEVVGGILGSEATFLKWIDTASLWDWRSDRPTRRMTHLGWDAGEMRTMIRPIGDGVEPMLMTHYHRRVIPGSSGTWVVRPETQYGPAEWEFVLDGPALQPEQMVIVPDGPLEAALSDASNTLRFQFREEGVPTLPNRRGCGTAPAPPDRWRRVLPAGLCRAQT